MNLSCSIFEQIFSALFSGPRTFGCVSLQLAIFVSRAKSGFLIQFFRSYIISLWPENMHLP